MTLGPHSTNMPVQHARLGHLKQRMVSVAVCGFQNEGSGSYSLQAPTSDDPLLPHLVNGEMAA